MKQQFWQEIVFSLLTLKGCRFQLLICLQFVAFFTNIVSVSFLQRCFFVCALVLSPCQTLGLLLMVCSWWRWVIYYLGIIRISKNITIWQGTFSPSGVNEGGRSHCRELTIDCGLYTSLIIVVYQKDRMSNLAAEVTC